LAGHTANLKSWKPGQSGNPGGRPKKRLLDSTLAELLEDSDGANTLAIARALVAKAKRGDLRACQLLTWTVDLATGGVSRHEAVGCH
jgi:hypothetical protein